MSPLVIDRTMLLHLINISDGVRANVHRAEPVSDDAVSRTVITLFNAMAHMWPSSPMGRSTHRCHASTS